MPAINTLALIFYELFAGSKSPDLGEFNGFALFSLKGIYSWRASCVSQAHAFRDLEFGSIVEGLGELCEQRDHEPLRACIGFIPTVCPKALIMKRKVG